MYFIVQMSEINPGHFHSTWCCVVALRKWCMVIDKARQLGTILIIKAARITERLGDDITLTEICREAAVVNRRISTVRYYLSRRAGLGGGKITNNSKMIGDKIVNRYSCN